MLNAIVNKSENISVFGLGYVGCITGICLAYLKHQVIGVDIDHSKVDQVNNAIPPITEPLLQDYLNYALENKYLTATTDLNYAIINSNISFICVYTPAKPNGDCDLSHITNLIKNIGQALQTKKNNSPLLNNKHVLIIRSTIPPGTIENIIIPTLEESSGQKHNKDFYICFYPEFLREASAIDDFFNPPEYVIGENGSKHASNTLIELLHRYLNHHKDIIIKTNYKTSELIKYTDNIWHALKVTFANEIGTLAKSCSIDAQELMSIFCADHKLNLSSYYLTPGLSYGGSCLPKDLQHMQYLIKNNNLFLPLIGSIAQSNDLHMTRTYKFILEHAFGKIGWYGITFKANTDDLRNSVQLEILEKLNSNYTVKFTDNNININKLTPFAETTLKNKLKCYKEQYLNSLDDLLTYSDTIIFGHPINDQLLKILNNYIDSKLPANAPLVIIDLNESQAKLQLSNLINKSIKYFNIF